MQMRPKERVKEVMGGLDHLNDCRCYKAEAGGLCKAEDIGLENFILCLEKNPTECVSSVYFGNVFFCKCRVRVHVAKESRS